MTRSRSNLPTPVPSFIRLSLTAPVQPSNINTLLQALTVRHETRRDAKEELYREPSFSSFFVPINRSISHQVGVLIREFRSPKLSRGSAGQMSGFLSMHSVNKKSD